MQTWLTDNLPGLIEKHGVPAAAVAVLADGEVLEAAAGVLNLRTGVEATTDSVFQVGSVTKLWTTTLAMQLGCRLLLQQQRFCCPRPNARSAHRQAVRRTAQRTNRYSAGPAAIGHLALGRYDDVRVSTEIVADADGAIWVVDSARTPEAEVFLPEPVRRRLVPLDRNRLIAAEPERGVHEVLVFLEPGDDGRGKYLFRGGRSTPRAH